MMSFSSFDFFWDNIIHPVLLHVDSEIDNDFKMNCNYSLKDIDLYKKELSCAYKRKREWLKSVYLPHDKNAKLDMHKLGAILCRIIIGIKPFSFDVSLVDKYTKNKFGDSKNNTDWFVDNVYVNYKLAFYASVGVIFIELLDYYNSQEKKNIVDMLNNRGTIFFYKKSDNHESFQNSCILSLMKQDTLHRSFDYFMYAAMLFQLEQYNKIGIHYAGGYIKNPQK